jgi:hypothetical protein
VGQRRKVWFGIAPPGVRDKKLLVASALYIQFLIWESKLKGRAPSFTKIEADFTFFLVNLYKIRNALFSSDPFFALSRNWPQIVEHGVH